MTEILGSGEGFEDASRRSRGQSEPSEPSEPSDPSGIEVLNDDLDDEPLDGARSRWGDTAAALVEPGSLAVAAALCVIASVGVGPSYRFDAYPFNQGVSSLDNLFSGQFAGIHPLHSYWIGVAASAVLTLAALVTGVTSLLRAREDQASWVRPVAAGATLVAVLLAALAVLGAYRSSTYDLRITPQGVSVTG
jgi:hypothetical protein